MENGSLMKVEIIAECSPWSTLQYFRPALSDNQSWKLVFFLSSHLRQVLLCNKSLTRTIVHLDVLHPLILTRAQLSGSAQE